MDGRAFRGHFPAAETGAYFDTATRGPLIDAAAAKIAECYEDLLERAHDPMSVSYGPDGWMAQTERTRRSLAALLGTDPASVAFVRDETEACAVLGLGLADRANGAGTGEGALVLVGLSTDHDRIPWGQVASTRGWQIRHVADAELGELLERVAAELSRNSRARAKLLVVGHVAADTGAIRPVAEIAALARTAGVPVVVDGTQAVGQVPVALSRIAGAAYVGSPHRWLFAPPGVGFMVVPTDLQPRFETYWPGLYVNWNWMRDEYTPKSDATRYEYASLYTPIIPALGAAVDQLTAFDLPSVRAHAFGLAVRLREDLAALPGVEVLTPPDPKQATGIVSFRAEPDRTAAIATRLKAANVAHRYLPELRAIRLAVAGFNTADECEQIVSEVRRGVDAVVSS